MVMTHGQKGEEFSGLTVKREPQTGGLKAEMMSCTQLPCSPHPRNPSWRHPSKITMSVMVMILLGGTSRVINDSTAFQKSLKINCVVLTDTSAFEKMAKDINFA